VYIEDSAKSDMNAKGVFLAPGQDFIDGAVVGEIAETDTASFWASGLMSPWRSFGSCASRFIRAVGSGDQETIRSVINTVFGELYAFRGDALPAETVRQCIGQYKFGEIPEGVKRITCGVDVQKRRLVYAVRGWGYSMESWLLDAGELWGETEHDAVWTQLGDVLQTEYGGRRIKRLGIDSGYRPGDKWRLPDNMVYAFCMQYRGTAVPTKGRDHLPKPYHSSPIDVNWRGVNVKNGLQLWHIDTDYFKTILMARFTWPEDKPGRFWVPQDVSDDYCSQVTAESRVLKPSGAATWIKVRPDNHYLDCETINFAMAQSLGFHRQARGTKKAATPAPDPQMPSSAVVPPRAPAPRQLQPGPPSRSKNWVTRW
jgi:phage terminase large subunit GpA-like protein